jgi:hypothetical protein
MSADEKEPNTCGSFYTFAADAGSTAVMAITPLRASAFNMGPPSSDVDVRYAPFCLEPCVVRAS